MASNIAERIPQETLQVITKRVTVRPDSSRRQSGSINWIFGLVVAIGVILCTAGIIAYLNEGPQKTPSSNTTPKPKQINPPDPKSDRAQETRRYTSLHRVKYEVTFSQTGGVIDESKYYTHEWSADLTYTNELGGTNRESDAKLPWAKTFLAERGQHLYISAQEGRGSAMGAITVWLYVDDKLVKTSTSKGAYTIATASVRL